MRNGWWSSDREREETGRTQIRAVAGGEGGQATRESSAPRCARPETDPSASHRHEESGRSGGSAAQPNGLATMSTKPGRSGARWSRLMGAAAAPAPPLLSAAAIARSCNRQAQRLGAAAARRGVAYSASRSREARRQGAVRGRAAAPRQARRDGGLPALPAAVDVRHLRAAHGGRCAPAAPPTAAGSAAKSPKPAARSSRGVVTARRKGTEVQHPVHSAQPARSGRPRPRRYALMRATRDATEWARSRCGCRAAGAGAGWALGTAARWQRSVAT